MSYPTVLVVGDQVTAQDFGDFSLNPTYTYGETISAGDALYLKAADGKVWKAAANAQAQVDAFVGFAIASGAANDTKRALSAGKVVTGLSGLTGGAAVYLQDTAGAVGPNRGTITFQVGIALSTTTMIVLPVYAKSQNIGVFGDGSDGDVTISAPTTLTRDMFYNNLTLSGAGNDISTAGFKIFVKGTLARTSTSKIKNNGGDGGAGSNATAGGGGGGGSAGAAGSGGTLPAGKIGVTGGGGATAINNSPGQAAGTAGTNGTAASPSIGTSNGAAGGKGGGVPGAGVDGGAGGSAGGATASKNQPRSIATLQFAEISSGTWTLQVPSPSGGGGGGGGGFNATGGGQYANGGGGGGSGGSAGIVFVSARYIVDTGSGNMFEAIGGGGGAGGNGAIDGAGRVAGGGGGGAGGNGGVIVRAYSLLTGTATTSVAGGSGGARGTDQGAVSSASVAGTAGNSGVAIDITV